MRKMSFKAVGGPHDGDVLYVPLASLPTSKSMVLQSKNDKIGVLHKYFFNKVTQRALYQGAVQVAKDEVG